MSKKQMYLVGLVLAMVGCSFMGNSWSSYKETLTQQLETQWAQEGAPDEVFAKSGCVIDGLIEILEKRKCPLPLPKEEPIAAAGRCIFQDRLSTLDFRLKATACLSSEVEE